MTYQIITLNTSYFDANKYDNIVTDLDKKEVAIVLVDSSTKMNEQLVSIANLYHSGKNQAAISSFQNFSKYIIDLCEPHFSASDSIYSEINDLLVEIEWIIEDEVMDSLAYYHDQIISIGILINSKIVTYILTGKNIDAFWQDSRDLIITDENYQNPNIIEGLTLTNIENLILKNRFVILPNKIAATLNITTTTFSDGRIFEKLFLDSKVKMNIS